MKVVSDQLSGRDTRENMNSKSLFWLLTTVLLTTASLAEAQQAKIPRVGYVSTNYPSSPGPLVEAFRQGLRDLGYVNGKNIVVDYRYGEEKTSAGS